MYFYLMLKTTTEIIFRFYLKNIEEYLDSLDPP